MSPGFGWAGRHDGSKVIARHTKAGEGTRISRMLTPKPAAHIGRSPGKVSRCDCIGLPFGFILRSTVSSAGMILWEDAFRCVIPQISADGLLVQKFDPILPVQVRF